MQVTFDWQAGHLDMTRIRPQTGSHHHRATADNSADTPMTGSKVAIFLAKTTGVKMNRLIESKPINSGTATSDPSTAKGDMLDYKLIFHALSAPCALLDREFRFVDMNDIYLATLNSKRERLLGRRVPEAFPESAEHQQMITDAFDKALAGTEASLREIQYAIPDLDAKGGMRDTWWNAHFTPLPNPHGEVAHVLLRVNDITELVRNRELKDAIAGEMQHRIGNLVAMITTIARQSARDRTSLAEFLPAFEARIQTLAKTHSLLSGGSWTGMTMDRLIHQQLDAYADKLGNTIFVEGPHLRVTAAEAQSISMALHELATNAAKHGALHQDGGRLSIGWSRLADGFEFEWNETGLTGVTEPTKSGFGTMILTRILPSQLNGEAIREFTPDSFKYRLRIEQRASTHSAV